MRKPFGRRVRGSAEENGLPSGVYGLEQDVLHGQGDPVVPLDQPSHLALHLFEIIQIARLGEARLLVPMRHPP